MNQPVLSPNKVCFFLELSPVRAAKYIFVGNKAMSDDDINSFEDYMDPDDEYQHQVWNGLFISQRQPPTGTIDQTRNQLQTAQGRFAARMNNDPDGGYSSDEDPDDGNDHEDRILESSFGVPGEGARKERSKEGPSTSRRPTVEDCEEEDPISDGEAGTTHFQQPAVKSCEEEDPISDDEEDTARFHQPTVEDEEEEADPISDVEEDAPRKTQRLYPIFEIASKRAKAVYPNEQAIYNEDVVPLDKVRLEKQAIMDREGVLGLVGYTIRQEVALYKTIDGVDERLLRSITWLIALETHPEILKVAMTGGWAYASLNNKKLKKVLRKLKDRAYHEKHPFIYLHELADKNGRSLTPNQLLVVIEIAESYYKAKDWIMANKIDRVKSPYPSHAQQLDGTYRKYVWNTKMKRLSKSRIDRGLKFCTNLRKRLAAIPPEKMDDPLEVPLIEIGYSMDISSRLRDHRNHRNSNPIMNLFEAIVSVQWPGKFTLWQFVIHCCCKPNRAALGEIFFTRLCEGYIFNAGGFSTYQAGVSVASAYDEDHHGWDAAEEWVIQHMLVEHNEAAEDRQWKLNLSRKRVEALPGDSEEDDGLYDLPIGELQKLIDEAEELVTTKEAATEEGLIRLLEEEHAVLDDFMRIVGGGTAVNDEF